jgi:RHS repeat-associated protein
LDHVRGQLAEIARSLRQELEHDDLTRRLASITGFGRILSHVLKAEIGQIERFGGNHNRLASYSLLGPRAMDTGEEDPARTPLGRHLGHRGNRTLKWTFLEAARAAVRHGGRLVEQKWQTDDANVVDRYTYGYDRNSNRLWRANEQISGLDEAYGYDGLNRLTKFNRGNLDAQNGITDPNAAFNQAWPELEALGNWRQFKWDPNGGGDSWTTQTRTHNKANETLTVSGSGTNWLDPNYDAAGNMIAGPSAANPANDPNSGHHYVYDAWNRLAAIRNFCDGDDLIVTYRYDGLNRRVRKCVGTEPGEDAWDDFYHNTSWQVLEVRHAEIAHPQDQYLWGGNYIDAAVVRWHDGNWDGDYNDGCDNVLYYTYDGNFNVTALVKTDGTVFERYAYDAYGAVTVLEPDFSADPDNIPDGYGQNEILYCGYRHDPESGLYCVRHRYYHPRVGRWISRDPQVYEDTGNLYEYARGEPGMFLDPFGDVAFCGGLDIHLVSWRILNFAITWKQSFWDGGSGLAEYVSEDNITPSIQENLGKTFPKHYWTGCPQSKCKIIVDVSFNLTFVKHFTRYLSVTVVLDGLKPKLAHADDNWWKGAQVAAEWDLELILRIRTRVGVCCN